MFSILDYIQNNKTLDVKLVQIQNLKSAFELSTKRVKVTGLIHEEMKFLPYQSFLIKMFQLHIEAIHSYYKVNFYIEHFLVQLFLRSHVSGRQCVLESWSSPHLHQCQTHQPPTIPPFI